MKRTTRALGLMLLLAALAAMAQQPEILSVSDVVVGSERLQTRYAFAMGKWSDAGDGVAIDSTEIRCYKRFGFCEVASANSMFGQAHVNFTSFDILRWDGREMIAVDSLPICVVNNLRFDFAAKKVSLGSTSKGETKDKLCDKLTPDTAETVFLIGVEDELKRKQKKK